jgi:hypothetical protein
MAKFKKKNWQFYFFQKREFMTEYSFSKMAKLHHQKKKKQTVEQCFVFGEFSHPSKMIIIIIIIIKLKKSVGLIQRLYVLEKMTQRSSHYEEIHLKSPYLDSQSYFSQWVPPPIL